MQIAIIGLGNLGCSLLEGLLGAGVPPADIFISELPERLTEVSEKYGVNAAGDINDAFTAADVVFLTVKSYVFEELAKNISRPVSKDKTIVSFMAGADFDALYRQIGNCRLVRAMPTLAISVNDGIIGYTDAPTEVAELFKKLGYAFECTPDEIEKVMAFSACGLGFAAYLIDAFKKAGQALGFSEGDSEKIASITFRNAVDRGDYENTVKSVATKGGATEQGVLHMDAMKTYDIVADAVQKAYDRMK